MTEIHEAALNNREEMDSDPRERSQFIVLFVSAGLISACAIVFELLIASLSTYFFGNSVYHFSLTIGIYMFSMGLGSYLSQCVKIRLLSWFTFIELYIGFLGGCSAIILFSAFGYTETAFFYYTVMVVLTGLIGIGVGFEIPIIIRRVKQISTLPVSVANVLAADYIGALIGSLAFPIVLLVQFGLILTGLIVGFLNILVALVTAVIFRSEIPRPAIFIGCSVTLGVCLSVAAAYSPAINGILERRLYRNPIEVAQQSPYQRIVVTKGKVMEYRNTIQAEKSHERRPRNAFIDNDGEDFRLFLDGDLQFSSLDEYRYHEALVHPGMSLVLGHKDEVDVLILGGGDGMAVREVLKYGNRVRSTTLVDLDSAVVKLAMTHPSLSRLNEHALEHPAVTIEYADAFNFLIKSKRRFDLIIADLPDPDASALSKLYSVAFYRIVKSHLTPEGIFVTQSTSPYFMPRAFWCIHQTLHDARFKVHPYTVYVPAFGLWGFNLACADAIDKNNLKLKIDDTDFLTDQTMKNLFDLPGDIKKLSVSPNTLNHPVIIKYYLDDENL